MLFFLKEVIESFPVNISTIARVFQLKPRTLYHWYKHHISHYFLDKASGKFAAHQVYQHDKQTGEVLKEQVVHIVQPEHVGERMCIDEKMINKNYVTIFSNQQTGKIALLLDSVKPQFIQQSMDLLGKSHLDRVKYIAADMSPIMKKVCRQAISQAKMVVDKFHVIKHIMDALNTVRLEIKKDVKQSKLPNDNNPNGWTDIELLEKTKYLLYKMENELSSENLTLLKFLLQKYPTLQTAYELVQEIRKWYHKNQIGQSIIIKQTELHQWIKRVNDHKIKAFKPIVTMFNNHYEDIIRYFEKGLTNAKAENLNKRIQQFMSNNFGTKDRDFFFYRVQTYFAAPEKKT